MDLYNVDFLKKKNKIPNTIIKLITLTTYKNSFNIDISFLVDNEKIEN